MAPPRLAWARLNVAVKSRTTTTSATSTTPSVVRATGPSARVSVRSASVTMGEFTVSAVANSRATQTSAQGVRSCMNGSQPRTSSARVVSSTSTATPWPRRIHRIGR